MANLINETFNLNVTSVAPVPPTPHTDGGGEMVNGIINGAAAPDTGFGAVINQLGPVGCSMVIVCLALLIGAIIFFCLRNKFRKQTFAKLSSLALLAFSVGLAVPSCFLISNALRDQSHITNLDMTVDSGQVAHAVVDAKLTLAEEADAGYTISAYIANNDTALHNKDNTSQIKATDVDAIDSSELPLNSYGVKNLATNKFSALSTDPNHPTVLYDTNRSTPAGTPLNISYAAKIDDTVPTDSYTGAIKYVIEIKEHTWDNITTMQQMTTKICKSQPRPGPDDVDVPTKTLIDERDGKTYTIAKLTDNKCWMTQNLDLVLDSSKTLTPDDTNLIENWTPIDSTVTTAPAFTSSRTAPRSLDLGDKYAYTSGNQNDDTLYNSLSACITTGGHTEAACKHYHVGNLYNWSAAVASNNTPIDDIYMTMNTSICPKGWRLPAPSRDGPSEVGSLLYQQKITRDSMGSGVLFEPDGFNKLRSTPLYWVRAGLAKDGSFTDLGVKGSYWFNTAYNFSVGYGAQFYSGYISLGSSDYGRDKGLSIRCIAQ